MNSKNDIEKNTTKVAESLNEFVIKYDSNLDLSDRYKKIEDIIDLLEHIIDANTIK